MSTTPRAQPNAGEIWQHYTGRRYRVVKVVQDGDDSLPVSQRWRVLYTSCEDGREWDLVMSRWMSSTMHLGCSVPRYANVTRVLDEEDARCAAELAVTMTAMAQREGGGVPWAIRLLRLAQTGVDFEPFARLAMQCADELESLVAETRKHLEEGPNDA